MPKSIPRGHVSYIVTAYQCDLIDRLRKLRTALWALSVDHPEMKDTAVSFSCASARAWKNRGFPGLAGEVHALAVCLESAPESHSVWFDARALAWELATEAGRIVVATEATQAT